MLAIGVVVASLASLLVCLLLRSRRRLADELKQVLAELEREREFGRRLPSDLQQSLDAVEKHKQFLSRFLRDLPTLTKELNSQVSGRRLADILLQIVRQALQPQRALVLWRRSDASGQPPRLVVAAVHSPGAGIEPGDGVSLGQGQLGLVAETQVVMSRYDFERERRFAPGPRSTHALVAFEPELAAPMVVDGETAGVIALSGLSYGPYEAADAKAALRLVAQIAALTVRHATVYRRTKHTADVDGLTKVFNKRHMIETLVHGIHQASDHGGGLTLFLFDIDNFKNYNDQNGHVAGDRLLSELAQLVKRNIREEDIFGRFGGEEFLLVLPDTELVEALVVAEKIRTAIAGHGFEFADRQPLGVVSVSGGVAAHPAHGLDSTHLLQAADEALYRAKEQGRNRVLPARREYLSGGEPELLVEDLDLVGEPAPD